MFVIWPLIRIVAEGFDPDALRHVATDARLRNIVAFTFVQAVLSTLGTVALALPAAWLVGRHHFAGRQLLTALWMGPFTLPTIVVGLAARRLLPGSVSTGLTAIVCAHIFFNVGIVARTVGHAWARLDPRPEEAAATLGASPWQVFRMVTAPRLTSAIASVAGLVFALSLTSFGVVLLLATPRQSTIEVEIWRQTTQLLRLDRAGALALLQLLIVGATLVATGSLRSAGDLRQRSVDTRIALRRRPTRTRIAAVSAGALMTLITIAPVVLLVERALRDPAGGHSLRAFRLLADVTPGSGLNVSPLSTVATSVRLALPAAVIATMLGALAAHTTAKRIGGRWAAAVLGLPLAVSAVTLGFGYLIAFADDPIAWRSKPWLVPVVQGLVAMPFVQRIVAPAVARLDPRLGQVAATLGASPVTVWRRVHLPLLARPALAGAGVALAVALGEFGATTFLARPGTITMPVAVARLGGRPGALLQAQSLALATLLGALTVAVTIAADVAGRERR